MHTTINQRVKEIADKLCGGNISEMARITGVNQPTLRDIVGVKQRKPSFDTLHKIAVCTTLNINCEWLINGKGNMQKHTANILQNATQYEVSPGAIPLYDIYTAGSLHWLLNNDKKYIIGEIVIPNAPTCDGAIHVRDNSMYPLIKGGTIAAYKQLHSLDVLIEGEMYIIDYYLNGDNMHFIRYVKWEEKNATLRLIAYNNKEHYQDMIIPVSAVRSIASISIVVSVESMI